MNALAQLVLGATLPVGVVSAVDLSSYRGFRFGADIASVMKIAGARPSDTRVVHQRPAVIEEVFWRAAPSDSPVDTNADPVTGGVLQFLDGQLCRIVIPYDRYRVEGLTPEDMIEAISVTYGAAAKPDSSISLPSSYGDTAKVLARWENRAYACDLVRTGDQSSFALVLYDKKRDALAQSAIQEALRLEALDGPRRALEADKKREEAERIALEKTRASNRRSFKP